MPPEGYTTVTLPDELATELEAVGDGSATRGIRTLLAAGADRGAEVDHDAIADAVAARLEGAKPLEDMAFDDWWEPDYAQTIAMSVVGELEDVDIAWDSPDAVSLEAAERNKIAQEVAEALR